MTQGRNKATSKANKPRRAGRGALMIIGTLFLTSGLLRLGDGAGEAIAREVEAFAASVGAGEQVALACSSDHDVSALLAAIQARELRIVQREASLTDRLQALRVAESAYEQNLAMLVAAETALSETVSRTQTAAEDDVSQLTSVYENMKSEDAAELFEEMDADFAAGFLGRMRPDVAAEIMSDLSPQTAYAISVILAGRNASAPTE